MGSGDPAAKLYVVLGSHACRTGMLLLDHKAVPYRTITIPTRAHLVPEIGSRPALAWADRVVTGRG